MTILFWLVLIFLPLLGYSLGRTNPKKGKSLRPGVLDVLFTLIIWIGSFTTQSIFDRTISLLIVFVLAGVIGIIVTLFVSSNNQPGRTSISDKKSDGGSSLKRIWERYKNRMNEVGNFQSRLLLIWFYFIVITPFGFSVRMFSDPLNVQQKKHRSYWVSRPHSEDNLEKARRQF